MYVIDDGDCITVSRREHKLLKITEVAEHYGVIRAEARDLLGNHDVDIYYRGRPQDRDYVEYVCEDDMLAKVPDPEVSTLVTKNH